MAKKKTKKTSEKAPEKLRISIRPDPKPDTPSYYVNFASVGHSEYDFTLSVLRIPSQLTPEQTELAKAKKQVPIEPLLEIMIPLRLIPGLIRAFTEQRRKYEEEFGPIKKEETTNEAG